MRSGICAAGRTVEIVIILLGTTTPRQRFAFAVTTWTCGGGFRNYSLLPADDAGDKNVYYGL